MTGKDLLKYMKEFINDQPDGKDEWWMSEEEIAKMILKDFITFLQSKGLKIDNL